MAILKFGKPITTMGHLTHATDYSKNTDKTLVYEDGKLAAALEYSMDEEKTLNAELLVTGINCNPDTAAKTMRATQKRFGKTDKILAHRFFLSFREDEVTPQVAHEIGVKWAQETFGDRFEVICSTHCDTDNLHADYVVNAVSFVDGKKYQRRNNDGREMKEAVNRLCKEYGISPIPEKGREKDKGFDEVKHFSGRKSMKQLVCEDIEGCIRKSYSLSDLYTQLENKGYAVNTNGKYPKIRASGQERFMRLATLGYTTEELLRRTENMDRPRPLVSGTYKPVFSKQDKIAKPVQGQKLTKMNAMYLHYLHKLGEAKKNPQASKISAEEYRKFNRYKRQLHFLVENNMQNLAEVKGAVIGIEVQIKTLDVERFKLLGAKKKHKALFEAYETYKRLLPLAENMESEQKQQFKSACEIMDKKGYTGKYDKVEEMRCSLMDAINANKTEVAGLKGERKVLENVLSDNGRMKHTLHKEAGKNYGRNPTNNQIYTAGDRVRPANRGRGR